METDREREFYVKDIPADFDEWKLLNVFRKYGIVDKIRLPTSPNQPANSRKFGFVTMANLASAEAVRAALVKNKIIVSNDIALTVNDSNSKAGGSSGAGGGQAKYGWNNAQSQNGPGSFGNKRSPNKNYFAMSTKPIIRGVGTGRFLPIGKPLKARIVDSPSAPSIEEGFCFHVLIDMDNPEYVKLYETLGEFTSNNSPIEGGSEVIQVNDPVLTKRDGITYRGMRTATGVYLIDFGEEVLYVPSNIWIPKAEHFAMPSLVVTCRLARTEWKDPSESRFAYIRNVLKQWAARETGLLQVKTEGYKGYMNLVELTGQSGTDLAQSLARKGDVTLTPKIAKSHYSREEILALKDKDHALPKGVNAEAISSILVKAA